MTCQKCLRALLLLWLALVSGFATAQVNSDFNVTVNPGPSAPTTVFPGEPTALRITLINNSTANPITGVNYNGGFSTLGSAGLVIDDGFSGLTGDCSAGTLTVTPGQPTIVVSGVEIPARQDGVAGSGECYVDLSVRAFTTDGGSTTLNLEVAAGDVDSDQGTNATGGPQAITVQAVSRPTMSKAFSANNLLVLNGATRTLAITINNPDNNIDLTDVGLTDVFPISGAGGAAIEPTGTAATGTCISGGGTADLTSGAAAQVAVSDVTVPAGGSCTVLVEVQARQTNGQYQVTPTNTINASSFTSREGVIPAANATAGVRVRSPLGITKNFNPTVLSIRSINGVSGVAGRPESGRGGRRSWM